ncbi:MAG: hypothetical protein H6922_05590 [Pseudomonadaceae bacterium]|nr:hypothetical protein [Pseudomonadaceae bacterium]
MRLPLTAALALFTLPALAQEYLPAGVVACISEKAARNYAQYSVSAPDFAADLLARATCYVNEEDMAEVVFTGKGVEFAQYKLLSGHKIWVAKGTTVSAKPQ